MRRHMETDHSMKFDWNSSKPWKIEEFKMFEKSGNGMQLRSDFLVGAKSHKWPTIASSTWRLKIYIYNSF